MCEECDSTGDSPVCKNCGETEVREGATFLRGTERTARAATTAECANCGHRLAAPEPAYKQTPPEAVVRHYTKEPESWYHE